MVCRILVADDSTTIQKVVRIGLAALPNDIRSVGSFVEAVKVAEPGKFDLIIADAGLPGVSTATDFMKLVDRAGRVPLIVLMGSYDVVRESDLQAAGIEYHLRKPFPPSDLQELVQSILSKTQGGVLAAPVQSPKPLEPVNPTPFSLVDEVSSWASSSQVPLQPHQNTDQLPLFNLGESLEPMVPPPGAIDFSRRGMPAFEEPSLSSIHNSVFSPSSPLGVRNENSSALNKMAPAQEEWPKLLEQFVERYCRENFKVIAREVLTAEIRRLAEEKARYLVDP